MIDPRTQPLQHHRPNDGPLAAIDVRYRAEHRGNQLSHRIGHFHAGGELSEKAAKNLLTNLARLAQIALSDQDDGRANTLFNDPEDFLRMLIEREAIKAFYSPQP